LKSNQSHFTMSQSSTTGNTASADSKFTLIAMLNANGMKFRAVSTGVSTSTPGRAESAFVASLTKSDVCSGPTALASCRSNPDPLSALQTLLTDQIDKFDPEIRAPWNTIEVKVVGDRAAMEELAEMLEASAVRA
jgi:hypothetical protein